MAQCKHDVERRDGVYNLSGGNGKGIGKFTTGQCERQAKDGSEFCWQHQPDEVEQAAIDKANRENRRREENRRRKRRQREQRVQQARRAKEKVDCRTCGGTGLAESAADMRRERGDDSGSIECIPCKGTGKEL